MEGKEINDLVNGIYDIMKLESNNTQNQFITGVLKRFRSERSDRFIKLQEETQALRVAMEDLDKLVRDSLNP